MVMNYHCLGPRLLPGFQTSKLCFLPAVDAHVPIKPTSAKKGGGSKQTEQMHKSSFVQTN